MMPSAKWSIWSKEEKERLRELVEEEDITDLHLLSSILKKEFGTIRTPMAITNVCSRLKISRDRRTWSKEEIELLKTLKVKKTFKELEPYFSRRKYTAIKAKANKLGIRTTERFWTNKEEEILKSLYPTAPKEEIVNSLKRFSWEAIMRKASTLGLRRLVSEHGNQFCISRNKFLMMQTINEIKEF